MSRPFHSIENRQLSNRLLEASRPHVHLYAPNGPGLILTSLGARPEGASLSIPIIACRVRGRRVKPCTHKPSLDRTLPRRERESIQSLDTKSCGSQLNWGERIATAMPNTDGRS